MEELSDGDGNGQSMDAMGQGAWKCRVVVVGLTLMDFGEPGRLWKDIHPWALAPVSLATRLHYLSSTHKPVSTYAST